jgi:hypothetical protein
MCRRERRHTSRNRPRTLEFATVPPTDRCTGSSLCGSPPSIQHTGTIHCDHPNHSLPACRVGNLLIPTFVANRVSIGPVAATIGILFWGWLWGVMGLLLAVPLTAFMKPVADLHPCLCHLSNMVALTPPPTPRWLRYSETALERAIPDLRPRGEKVSTGR